MPNRTYMGVDERRDHSLRVPRPDLSNALGTPNACNLCHASMTGDWAAKKIESWFGEKRRSQPHWGGAIHAARSDALDAEARLVAMLTNPSIPGIARATAISLLPRFASPASMSVFSRAIGDDDPLVRTTALEALDGFPPDLRVALAADSLADPIRSVRFEAARILASVPEVQLESSARLLRKVLSEYRDAQAKDADRAEPHMRLGALALAEGQLDLAQKEFELARTRNPSFVPAYVNLADLYRLRGMDDEGEKVLRKALEIVPDQPAVRHALGLLLVRLKRLDEALIELEFAAQQQPSDPRYSYVYAVALHTAGDVTRARAVVRKASAEHPADRDLRSFLAILERQR
jgi:tetratricopeptide (TPR) repeat protein